MTHDGGLLDSNHDHLRPRSLYHCDPEHSVREEFTPLEGGNTQKFVEPVPSDNAASTPRGSCTWAIGFAGVVRDTVVALCSYFCEVGPLSIL